MAKLALGVPVLRKRLLIITIYFLATVQFVWCYLSLVRPYVSTFRYEHGIERMPFQGRMLVMFPMRWAHSSTVLAWLATWLTAHKYWFPRAVFPEVIAQAAINLVCVVIAGLVATRLYQATSSHRLLTPMVYPTVLAMCVGTYVLHTIQNFRFIYDLPSLAFFSIAMYLLYFRKSLILFAALFVVATVNRETTLLLLGFFLLSEMAAGGRFGEGPYLDWRRLFTRRVAMLVVPLSIFWLAWEYLVHQYFSANVSEFYPRVHLNFSFLYSPDAWPQLLGGCCYVLPLLFLFRNSLRDPQLRAWLWVLPAWLAFMFVYGILVETRIFGELIPFVSCLSILIAEEAILQRLAASRGPLQITRPAGEPLSAVREPAVADAA